MDHLNQILDDLLARKQKEALHLAETKKSLRKKTSSSSGTTNESNEMHRTGSMSDVQTHRKSRGRRTADHGTK